MIFISDVHHQLEFLKLLPKKNEPVVILGDLINWIDYRNGDGIAKEVFGLENVQKLINLRKEHRFEERKDLWKSLYSNDPEVIMKNMRDAIENQYEEVFKILKKYHVWFIPGNVDDVEIMNSYTSSTIKNVDGLLIEHQGTKLGFAGGGVPTPINARGEISEIEFSKKHQAPAEAIVVSWILHHPARILPVLGSKNPDRIRRCARSLEVKLSREEWFELYCLGRGSNLP